MKSRFIELTISKGNYNTKYVAFIDKSSIVSIIEDYISDKYPPTKISLMNGETFRVWEYRAKELMEFIK